MPHYADGTEARVGDIVKGRGYNVPHEVVGMVVALKPGQGTCNVTVACVARDHLGLAEIPAQVRDGKIEPIANAAIKVPTTYEYGQADAFEKLA